MTEAVDPVHEAILQAWECALVDTPVVYLSGPITTGPRLVESLRSGKGDALDVVRLNASDIVETAARIRRSRYEVVVEPASLSIKGWSQHDYLKLWARLIERHVKLMLFMPGWEYSIGCVTEFVQAVRHKIRTESLSGSTITLSDARRLLQAAIADLSRLDEIRILQLSALAANLTKLLGQLEAFAPTSHIVGVEPLRKDAALDVLADKLNVAQFVSFAPHRGAPKQAFSRVAGETPNVTFKSVRQAVEALLHTSVGRSVNVRSYEPENPQSREFLYGLKETEQVVSAVERLTAEGLHTIVNETIDIHDGGVSGVAMGDIIEFAPDDTPRCVEKPGTALLPRGWGRELLTTVYGVPIAFDVPLNARLEFSIHPRPQGWKQTNMLAWEYAEDEYVPSDAKTDWPNRFSRFLGDKVYGLLVAHHAGLPVPATTVISRRVAPFSFGRKTRSGETWIRTAPVEQVPGKFSTNQGWVDPFKLAQIEDPENNQLASLLSQQGVRQMYSGALIVSREGDLIVEGKAGEGQTLMLGLSAPEELPPQIQIDIRELYARATAALGQPVRFEWVHDGEQAWIVQMHSGATQTSFNYITAESAKDWQEFDVKAGLEELRQLVARLPIGTGIALSGRVGLTSHFADVLRRAKVPARMG
ncbi:hypothetical protein [Mesorhizobium sp. M0053]|uniref:hypothetical protein n=1 Tax=Mesorhizobium sp. M0053 TaxID=2956864 RepID=UPI0033376707